MRADLDGKVSPLDLHFRTLLYSAVSFHSETHSEIQNTKAIALVFWSIFGHYKGAYFQLLRVDLGWKVLTLDLPFRVALYSVISFHSETHSEIHNTKAIALVFWSILGHHKGGLFSAYASRSGWESIATRFAFPNTII